MSEVLPGERPELPVDVQWSTNRVGQGVQLVLEFCSDDDRRRVVVATMSGADAMRLSSALLADAAEVLRGLL